MDNSMSSQAIQNNIYNCIITILKKWQIILLVFVLCGLGFDLYETFTFVPRYQCNANFAIDSSSNNVNTDEENENIADTFTYIFSSNVFKRDIQKSLGIKQLDGTFSAKVQPGTNIVNICAEANTPKVAFDMMNALVDNYQRISKYVVGSRKIDLLGKVGISDTPYNGINHKKNIIVVGGLAGIVTILVITLIYFLKGTIKDKSEIENKLNIKLIGSLPKERKRRKCASILITQMKTSFYYIEEFKKIRSSIERYCKKHDAKVILVTSSIANEGKSSISSNIALSLSMKKKKVLLIDGDLRKPSIQQILNEKKYKYGFEHVLNQQVSLDEAITKKTDTLDVLYNYNEDLDILNKVNTKTITSFIEEAKEKYDYVIIDSSPSCFIADTSILSSYVDGILLVVRQNFAVQDMILRTIDKLSITRTPIIGCIYNQTISIPLQTGKYYGYKYGYNTYYQRRRRD